MKQIRLRRNISAIRIQVIQILEFKHVCKSTNPWEVMYKIISHSPFRVSVSSKPKAINCLVGYALKIVSQLVHDFFPLFSKTSYKAKAYLLIAILIPTLNAAGIHSSGSSLLWNKQTMPKSSLSSKSPTCFSSFISLFSIVKAVCFMGRPAWNLSSYLTGPIPRSACGADCFSFSQMLLNSTEKRFRLLTNWDGVVRFLRRVRQGSWCLLLDFCVCLRGLSTFPIFADWYWWTQHSEEIY